MPTAFSRTHTDHCRHPTFTPIHSSCLANRFFTRIRMSQLRRPYFTAPCRPAPIPVTNVAPSAWPCARAAFQYRALARWLMHKLPAYSRILAPVPIFHPPTCAFAHEQAISPYTHMFAGALARRPLTRSLADVRSSLLLMDSR